MVAILARLRRQMCFVLLTSLLLVSPRGTSIASAPTCVDVGDCDNDAACDDGNRCTADACLNDLCCHTPVCPDTFLCYDVTASKGAQKFRPVPGVHIVDIYEDVFFTVTELRELCNPASRDDSVPMSPTHLNRYQITASKNARRSMPKSVVVDNEFGTITLDAIIGDKFLVPTAKSLVGTPTPLPNPRDVDHFKCYDVVVHKGTPNVPKGTQITLTDQFTGAPKVFNVLAPVHLCPVARKNNEPVLDPCSALLCYDVVAASRQPEFRPVKNIFTEDQFGMLKSDAIDEDEVCVPSTIRGAAGPKCLETPTTTTTTTRPSTSTTRTSTTRTTSTTKTTSSTTRTSTSTTRTSTSTTRTTRTSTTRTSTSTTRTTTSTTSTTASTTTTSTTSTTATTTSTTTSTTTTTTTSTTETTTSTTETTTSTTTSTMMLCGNSAFPTCGGYCGITQDCVARSDTSQCVCVPSPGCAGSCTTGANCPTDANCMCTGMGTGSCICVCSAFPTTTETTTSTTETTTSTTATTTSTTETTIETTSTTTSTSSTTLQLCGFGTACLVCHCMDESVCDLCTFCPGGKPTCAEARTGVGGCAEHCVFSGSQPGPDCVTNSCTECAPSGGGTTGVPCQ